MPAMSASLTHAAARAVLDAGIAEADAIGQPMNIAVVDDGGHLVAFARMDGAIKASIDISTRKAKTAVLMNLPTSALSKVTQPGEELYGLEWTSGGLVTFGGGVLLVRDPRLRDRMRTRQQAWPRQTRRAYAAKLVTGLALLALASPRVYPVFVRVADVLSGFPAGRRPHLERCLLLLAKYGLVIVTPSSPIMSNV